MYDFKQTKSEKINTVEQFKTTIIEDKSLINYAEQYTSAESALFKNIERYTHLHALNPRMLPGHIQGKLLELLSCMIHPQYILEIGTYTAYSALCLAKGLTENGILHSIERNDELHDAAQSFVNSSGYAHKICLHVGDARDVVPNLTEIFDLIYIDGDKSEYCDYYHIALKKLRIGGFIIADNVLWGRKVINEPVSIEKRTKGITAFNDLVQGDSCVENVFLPFRDGLMIIRKLYEINL